MRSAYRATMAEDQGSFNIGIRLVRNALLSSGSIVSTGAENTESFGPRAIGIDGDMARAVTDMRGVLE